MDDTPTQPNPKFKFGDEVDTPYGKGVVINVEGNAARSIAIDMTDFEPDPGTADVEDMAKQVSEYVKERGIPNMELDGLVEVEFHPGVERFCQVHHHMVAADETCPADIRMFRPADLTLIKA